MPDVSPTIPEREIASDRSAWLLQTLENDLGDRFLSFDDDGVMLESLRVRGELTASPAFASDVRRRARELTTRSPWLAAIRAVSDDAQGGLTVRTEHGDITRIRELVSSGPCDQATALAVLEQALYCVSLLHALAPQVAHGAITLDRLAMTPAGHLQLLDCAFGGALAAAALDEETLFAQLSIVNGGRPLDQAGDVLQCGVIALELLRGKRLTPADVRDADRTIAGVLQVADPQLTAWLSRALQRSGRFVDAAEALAALQPLLAGTVATRAALVSALAGRTAPAAAIDVLSAAPRVAQRAAPPPVQPPAAAPSPQSRRSLAIAAIILLASVVVLQAIYIARRSAPIAITVAPPAAASRAVDVVLPVAPPPVISKQPSPVPTPPSPPVRTSDVRPAAFAGGWVTVRAPFEVDVLSDGELVGTSRSSRIMLPDGRHTLTLVNDTVGFRTTADVSVAAGRAAVVDVPVPNGTLSVNASPWATVTIDGTSYGETPIGNLQVPVGSHEVLFHHPDLGDRRQTIVVKPGAPARVSVDYRK